MIFSEEDVIKSHNLMKGKDVLPPEISARMKEYIKVLKEFRDPSKGLYAPKDDKKDEFRKVCLDSFKYFTKLEPCMVLMYIRELTEESISLSYEVFPEFKNFVSDYSPLLRAARAYKE